MRDPKEWQFFGVLSKADRVLAVLWWTVLLLRGLLPAALAIAMGSVLVSVQRGKMLFLPLFSPGIVFVLLQILARFIKLSAQILATARPLGSSIA
jgi:ATP-binding cassette subfamily B protein